MTAERPESELPPRPLWSNPESVRQVGWQRAVAIVIVGIFVTIPGTIDSYNREVLETCEVPPNSTLLRTYVLPVIDDSGQRLRSMSYVYASPLQAQDVAAFYQVTDAGVWTDAPPERACRFGNRPSVLVLSLWTTDHGTALNSATETGGLPSDLDDEFWAGKGAAGRDRCRRPTRGHPLLRAPSSRSTRTRRPLQLRVSPHGRHRITAEALLRTAGSGPSAVLGHWTRPSVDWAPDVVPVNVRR